MKAVLVIDMPESCDKCKFYDGDCCYATAERKWEGLSCRGVDNWQIREDWCPLKPMLKKQELKKGRMTDGEEILEAYIFGYNACIEELEEIGEENADS